MKIKRFRLPLTNARLMTLEYGQHQSGDWHLLTVDGGESTVICIMPNNLMGSLEHWFGPDYFEEENNE